MPACHHDDSASCLQTADLVATAEQMTIHYSICSFELCGYRLCRRSEGSPTKRSIGCFGRLHSIRHGRSSLSTILYARLPFVLSEISEQRAHTLRAAKERAGGVRVKRGMISGIGCTHLPAQLNISEPKIRRSAPRYHGTVHPCDKCEPSTLNDAHTALKNNEHVFA